MDGILTAINDFFRGILFSLAQCFLFVFDIVWEIVKRIITLDISDQLYTWYGLIIVLIVLFLIFRIIKIYMKTMFDEDYRERINIPQILIKITLASFAMGFTPIAFSFVSEMTSDLIGHIEYFIPSPTAQADGLKPSSVLLEAGRINISDINGDLGAEINVTDNFNVNAKDENDNYIYFATYTSLFLLIIESVAGCFIFLLIAIMIGQRLFSIAYKYLLSPYPISGLIDSEDKSFATWMKMLLGDFMMNFAQVYGVYLTIVLCNNGEIQRMIGNDVIGICAKIILFLAGLVAVLNLPSMVATIIGGHGAGAFESLREMTMITTMTKSLEAGVAGATVGVGIGAIGGAIGGVASAYHDPSKNSKLGYAASGAAGAIRGGAETAKRNFTGGSMGGGVTAGARILKGGISAVRNKPTGASSQSQGKYGFINQAGGGIDRSSPAFSEPPTDQQLYYAGQLGIDNPESYSKGELSMMIQERGGEQSYWDGTEQGEAFKLNGVKQEMDQSFNGDESIYTPRTTDHINNVTGEKIYGDTLKTRLQKSSIDSGQSATKLNGKPLKK